MRAVILIASVAGALAACAPVPGQGGGASYDRPCFVSSRVVNFRGGEDRNLYLKLLGGDVYEADTVACPDLDYAISLAIVPDTGISDRLCVGDMARVYTPRQTIGPNPCRVRIERRLTEAEVEALPSRSRP